MGRTAAPENEMMDQNPYNMYTMGEMDMPTYMFIQQHHQQLDITLPAALLRYRRCMLLSLLD